MIINGRSLFAKTSALGETMTTKTFLQQEKAENNGI
jgi:hypothetical protein